SATASAPPGQKSFWMSITISALSVISVLAFRTRQQNGKCASLQGAVLPHPQGGQIRAMRDPWARRVWNMVLTAHLDRRPAHSIITRTTKSGPARGLIAAFGSRRTQPTPAADITARG